MAATESGNNRAGRTGAVTGSDSNVFAGFSSTQGVMVSKADEPPNRFFPTTHWTALLQPISERSPDAHAAMEKLMTIYREPIVRFVRSLITDTKLAEDIAHDFIERLLERGDLERANRSKGRFRSFLAKSIQNFVADRLDSEKAVKRKDLVGAISLEQMEVEPGHSWNGEREFTRRWWRATLDEVERRLRTEWAEAGKEQLLDDLLPLLWDGKAGRFCDALATRHNMSAANISVRKHRLADRYREILVSVLRETVATQAEVDEEIRHFLQDI